MTLSVKFGSYSLSIGLLKSLAVGGGWVGGLFQNNAILSEDGMGFSDRSSVAKRTKDSQHEKEGQSGENLLEVVLRKITISSSTNCS